MQEVWKDIPGYEGLYMISDLGKIKSLTRNIIRVPRVRSRITNNGTKILPYPCLNLTKNGKPKFWFVHRLVMLSFVGTMPKGCNVVKHIDDDPTNCALSNLGYGTQKDNVIECYRKGRGHIDLKVLKERALKGANARKRGVVAFKDGVREEFDGIRPAARALNVLNGAIGNVLAGRLLSTGGYKFNYL